MLAMTSLVQFLERVLLRLRLRLLLAGKTCTQRFASHRTPNPTTLRIFNEYRSFDVRVADTFASRLIGLLNTDMATDFLPMLLLRSNCVHSFGMRGVLDIVFFDSRGKILRVTRLKRYRLARCAGASHVLELAAGQAEYRHIKAGQYWRIARGSIPPTGPGTTQTVARRTSPAGARWSQGASMVELLIAAPVLLLFGLSIVQLGLVYNAQTIVNHATFEAARVGAVEHALSAPMREELARRLAPQEGGDGTAAGAALALIKSRARAADETTTRLRLLSPTREAFDDWALHDEASGGLAIPNAHLRHRDPRDLGSNSGLNLQDANLLEIEVVHGYPLTVPVASQFLAGALSLVDRENAEFYERGLLPLKSVSRVRMQSEAWEQSLSAAATDDTSPDESVSDVSIPPDAVVIDDCIGNHGLGPIVQLPSEAELLAADCLDPAPATGGGSSASIPPPANSVDCASL